MDYKWTDFDDILQRPAHTYDPQASSHVLALRIYRFVSLGNT